MSTLGNGYFSKFGGQFVAETLIGPLKEVERAYNTAIVDSAFRAELTAYLNNFAGRPTPLFFAKSLTRKLGGAKIYLKREDLLHTGAHKITNCIGQALLAKRMGKRRVVADTGAGQHGVATAAACAVLGIECCIHMGSVDMERQKLNVDRMRLLGATVSPVTTGSRTLKDAVTETIRDWVSNVDSTYCLLGSVVGPHPYPSMVRNFQKVIGAEAREQILQEEGRLPSLLIACVGGGSNAIGLFHPFIDDAAVRMIGVEAGGKGIESGRHASRFNDPAVGRVGVMHGAKSYLLQTAEGQVLETHSISAGLDYSSVGPEHAMLFESERISYVNALDDEALAAVVELSRSEGIIPALESAHAVAHCLKIAPTMDESDVIIVNLSGRGDKDLGTIFSHLDI